MIRSSAVAGLIVVTALTAIAFGQEQTAQTPATSTQTPSSSTQTAASPAQAPAPPPTSPPPAPEVLAKVQVFGGYSFLHEDTGNLNATNFDVDLHIYPRSVVPRTNFNGWNAEAQYNFGPWLGAAVDISGFNGFPFTPGNGVSGLPSGTSYSFLIGPVISYRKLKRITPFAHVLVGWNRTSVASSALNGTVVPVTASATTYNDFVISPGAGVDWAISRRFAVRLAQVDWFHTSLNLNSFYGSVFGIGLFQGFETNERNLRFSTGFVVNF